MFFNVQAFFAHGDKLFFNTSEYSFNENAIEIFIFNYLTDYLVCIYLVSVLI